MKKATAVGWVSRPPGVCLRGSAWAEAQVTSHDQPAENWENKEALSAPTVLAESLVCISEFSLPSGEVWETEGLLPLTEHSQSAGMPVSSLSSRLFCTVGIISPCAGGRC